MESQLSPLLTYVLALFSEHQQLDESESDRKSIH